jgi:sugar transferase (PEP-CTERM/EpsH1 system associated)
MDIIYVSHCVPWPPDKGDRIRAHNSVRELVAHHRVHLAALARSEAEAAVPSALRERCASVHIEVLRPRSAIMRGLAGFAAGGSFTTSFYHCPGLHAHVRALIQHYPVGAVVVLSSSMALYAPERLPFLADWGDVDSEKRLQYARMRTPGLPHRIEGLRLRRQERAYAERARRTFLTTPNELALFRRIAPKAALSCAGNGIDCALFSPDAGFAVPEELKSRNFLLFVGVLDYFPNSDGVCWFAESVFPIVRQAFPGLELLLVGRNPVPAVLRLARQEGVRVVGAVADVRPYLAASRAVIAPLRIARGIQNKVLEALAMGKHVLASEAVCATFTPELPPGVHPCPAPADYAQALAAVPASGFDPSVREVARARFDWSRQLWPLLAELEAIAQADDPSEMIFRFGGII